MNDFMQNAHAAVKAGNIAQAVGLFRSALQQNPGDMAASAWLGQCLCNLGQREEGLPYLREAGQRLLDAARSTKNIDPVLEIIAQLQHWSDFPSALGLGREAASLNGTGARVFQLLAVTYSQLNKRSEAVSAGEQALKRDPENAMMQILQGNLEAEANQNEAARQRLEKVLTRPLNAREGFRAHKELARVLDRLGDYSKVFPHLHEAGRLSASLPEFNRQNLMFLPNLIRSYQAGLDRDILGRWSQTEFQKDQAPVFLVGFMRSGTTLTQEVMDAHPDIFVADESDFIWAMHRELHTLDKSTTSTAAKLRQLDRAGIQHLRTFYWNRVRQRFGDQIGTRRFVDKFTMNTIDLGLINCVFPDAKVVFVLRDPRDVCFSCFLQLMVPTPATVHLQTWQGTAEFYAQVMKWWMDIREKMTLDFIEFRYEDAISEFETVYRKVFDFLGVAWHPEVADFHKHAAQKHITSPSRGQVTQPLYSSSVARWRHYESDFAPVANILRPIVEAYRYDPF